MTRLSRLLRPGSVAVIGGGTWCENVIEQCGKIGFQGPIYPVHPTRDTVARRPAFRSVDALPEPPDAAFIGINREATIETVEALARHGAGGAVCFASGFREAEIARGAELQQLLLDAAGDMPVLGPNCYGYLTILMARRFGRISMVANGSTGGVAIITQSSISLST